jgi:uncharacterized protein (TIRG00374 family)
MPRRASFTFILSLIISGIAFYYVFHGVPLDSLVDYFMGIDPLSVLGAALMVVTSVFVRALRWRYLIRPHSRLPFSSAYHPLVIGLMANCALPARVGELVRPLWHKARCEASFSGCLASLAVERFFDVLILLGFLATTFCCMDFDSAVPVFYKEIELSVSLLWHLATILFLVCLFLFAGILLLGTKTVGAFIKQLILKIFDLATKRLPMIGAFASTRGGTSWLQLIDRVAEGFSIMRNVTDTLICLGLSILYWLLWAFGYYLLSQGSPSINLTFVQAVASMVVICLFIALPSIPGYWGLWEAGGVFSLSLFGFRPEQSAGITLANHVVQMFPICLAGVISVWMTGFHFSRLHSSAISSYSDDVQ